MVMAVTSCRPGEFQFRDMMPKKSRRYEIGTWDVNFMLEGFLFCLCHVFVKLMGGFQNLSRTTFPRRFA